MVDQIDAKDLTAEVTTIVRRFHSEVSEIPQVVTLPGNYTILNTAFDQENLEFVVLFGSTELDEASKALVQKATEEAEAERDAAIAEAAKQAEDASRFEPEV